MTRVKLTHDPASKPDSLFFRTSQEWHEFTNGSDAPYPYGGYQAPDSVRDMPWVYPIPKSFPVILTTAWVGEDRESCGPGGGAGWKRNMLIYPTKRIAYLRTELEELEALLQ